MTYRLTAMFVFLGLLALPAVSQAQLLWDFNNPGGNFAGWTTIQGFGPSFQGAGIEQANNATGGRAHDAASPTSIFASPEFTFTGNNTLAGATAIRVNTEGGAGNQSGSPDPVDPNAVITYNGGNTNSSGQKGAALFNTTTGLYDHVFYDGANGGAVDLQSADTTTLTGSGVNLADGYQVHIFETDDGGWGWTRWNDVEVDATLGGPPQAPAVPEPSALLLSLIGLLTLLGTTCWRHRRGR